jgi:hypothetical protein
MSRGPAGAAGPKGLQEARNPTFAAGRRIWTIAKKWQSATGTISARK